MRDQSPKDPAGRPCPLLPCSHLTSQQTQRQQQSTSTDNDNDRRWHQRRKKKQEKVRNAMCLIKLMAFGSPSALVVAGCSAASIVVVFMAGNIILLHGSPSAQQHDTSSIDQKER
eukprot:scaffold799_cov107-Skeletonema_marinoi.AAC.5